MNSAIWEVAEAWICVSCRHQMEAEYVIRNLGPVQRRKCDRCGRNEYVSKCRYTMSRAGLERRGRLEG